MFLMSSVCMRFDHWYIWPHNTGKLGRIFSTPNCHLAATINNLKQRGWIVRASCQNVIKGGVCDCCTITINCNTKCWHCGGSLQKQDLLTQCSQLPRARSRPLHSTSQSGVEQKYEFIQCMNSHVWIQTSVLKVHSTPQSGVEQKYEFIQSMNAYKCLLYEQILQTDTNISLSQQMEITWNYPSQLWLQNSLINS